MHHSPIMQTMLSSVVKGCQKIKEIYDSYDLDGNTLGIQEKHDYQRLKDFQTRADTLTEDTIYNILKKHHPDIGFFGEEGSKGSIEAFHNSPYFILDPLDGTSNFVSKRDYFAISLGYVVNQQPHIGVIANPLTGKIVAAEKDRGAYVFPTPDVDGTPLPTVQDIDLSHTQIDCEFSFTTDDDIRVMALLTRNSMGMRKHGSTALDIFEMACGRRNSLVANNQKPYDIAAGLVIAHETGMIISDWSGHSVTLNTQNIIIANPIAHEEILNHLKSRPHD